MQPDADDAVEAAWCDAQRATISAYLKAQGLQHGEIGDWPAWRIVPTVCIWAIESLSHPGQVGWWAITGDVPTDYISAAAVTRPQHPRKALTVIASAWLTQAMSAQPSTDAGRVLTGSIALTDELMPMLESRARLLLEWSADDSLWESE